MRVYVVRHGQSLANIGQFGGGWMDVPLTELGRQQAAALTPVFEQIKMDKVFTSDLSRAKDTCSIAIPGCDMIIDEALREVSVGHYAGQPKKDYYEKYGDVMKNAAIMQDYSAFGGETNEQVRQRIFRFIEEEILPLEGSCDRVAVFGHEGTIRAFINYIQKSDILNGTIKIRNASITEFEILNGNMRLLTFGYTPNLLEEWKG